MNKSVNGPGVFSGATERVPAQQPAGPQLGKAVQSGGSAGNASTQCSYTYSLFPLGADTSDSTQRLATGLTPKRKRMSAGVYTHVVESSDWSYCLYDHYNGSFILLDVYGETFDPGAC